MRDGWREVKVSDVARIVGGGTPRSAEPSYWGGEVPWITPKDLSERPAMYTSGGARSITQVGLSASAAQLLPAGAVLLTSRAPVGYVSIAQIPVATNQGFKSLILADGQMPEYWYYLLGHSTEYLRANSGGSTFQELSTRQVRGLTFRVPPLAEQRRTVDLLRVLDAAIRAAQTEIASCRLLLEHFRRIPSGADDRIPTALGDLVVMRSGPSWKAADESSMPIDRAQPVLGITNTPSGSRVVLHDRKYVTGIPSSVQLLDQSSLVMIRTNGNRSRIGNIYRAVPEVDGFAVSAFQIAMRPLDPGDKAFLYWYIGSSEVQESIKAAASGSTGLGNVAVGWLKLLPIPNLELPERSRYVALCESTAAVVESAESEHSRLVKLRISLLDGLLSGEHVIPESYEERLVS